MEPEKFLTPREFNALVKVAKDDRERRILLLLSGAGLRVGEMTQIRAELMGCLQDFSKFRRTKKILHYDTQVQRMVQAQT